MVFGLARGSFGLHDGGMQDAIIYHSPNGRVTGAVLDALDCFAALQLRGRAVRMIVIGLPRADVETLLRDRFRSAEQLQGKVDYLLTRVQLAKQSFDRVLLPYSAFKRVRWFLKARQLYILPTQLLRYDFNAGRMVQRPNCCFLLDERQHPYPVAHQRPYRKRAFLDDLPECSEADDAVLVSCVSSHKQHQRDELQKALAQCRPYQQAIALTYRRHSGLPGVEALRPPVAGFFQRFNHYLYLPAKGNYDENPRLLIEAAWLGKRITIGGDFHPDDPVRFKLEELRSNPGAFRLLPDDLIFELFPES